MSSISRKVFTALAASAVAASAATAQDIQIQGAATGPGVVAPTTGTTTLTFAGSTFDGFTVGGSRNIGSAPGVPNFNNFGSFSLGTSVGTFVNAPFTLTLTFTMPTLVNPAQAFSAVIDGSINTTAGGGVFVDFSAPNNPRTVTFTAFQPAGGGPVVVAPGSFQLLVNNLSIDPGSTVAVTGRVFALNVVPEPSTYALMGTGLLGLLGVARRRKQNA